MENVFWLSGSSYLRKLTLDKIKGQFVDGEILYFDRDVSYAELEEAIYQENCFVDKRLIIISSFPTSNSTRATVVNNLKKMIEAMPSNCFLVFNNLDGEGSKPLITHISKHGKIFEYETTLEKSNAPFWVVKAVAELGKHISDEAASLFVEINGYDPESKGIGLDVLKIGIDKLVQYVGNRKKTIEIQDVIINSFPSSEFVIWSIFDAMDSRDIVKCSTALKELVDNADSPMSAVIQLFNVALWRFRLLEFAKESLAKNPSKADTQKEIASLIKIHTEGTGFAIVTSAEKDQNGNIKPAYTEFTVNKELNGHYSKGPTVDKYTRIELFRIMQCIYDGMAEIRLRPNDASLLMLADILMFSVCGSLTDKHLAKLRCSLENEV